SISAAISAQSSARTRNIRLRSASSVAPASARSSAALAFHIATLDMALAPGKPDAPRGVPLGDAAWRIRGLPIGAAAGGIDLTAELVLRATLTIEVERAVDRRVRRDVRAVLGIGRRRRLGRRRRTRQRRVGWVGGQRGLRGFEDDRAPVAAIFVIGLSRAGQSHGRNAERQRERGDAGEPGETRERKHDRYSFRCSTEMLKARAALPGNMSLRAPKNKPRSSKR